MYKHLVLSVDYTQGWEQAVAQLPPLLRRLGTRKLTLVYIIELYKRQHVEDSEGAVRGKLKTLAEKLAESLGVEADYRVGQGFVASRILNIAKTVEADGVIVCNSSHSTGKELLLGNTAVNMARMTKLPLLVLPMDGAPATEQAPVLFCTDGSKASSNARACFERLMAEGNAGEVLWVQPADADEQSDDIAREVHSLANQFLNVQARILSGRPPRAILQVIEQTRPALTLMGKRGLTPIPDVLLGSTAQAVVRGSTSPVLLVP